MRFRGSHLQRAVLGRRGKAVGCPRFPAALLFDRGPRYSFGYATILTTASASAQTPIRSANTAIVPKATRPMPVIASLIDSLHSRDVPDSLHRIY